MNKLKTLVIGLVLIASSGIAHAVSVSGNMAITSDYIWRGMTQNGGEVSVSGGYDLETDSGFYIGTWGGSAKFGNGESLELDYYGGYAGSIGDIGYDIGFIEVTYPGVSASDFSETYLGLDVMGVGLFYAAGDEFGDYSEISYGFDAGPGSIGLSYGDYEDSGTNYVIGYDIPVGDFTLSLAYTDFESDSGTADEDAFVVTLGM
ncbi:MAG: hypothetical protein CMK55_02705 [Proteobacteria bacterium]|nr:hypothetical protein [Pseudomonadota bacterium]